MATQVQFRRGTTAEHSGFKGADGEVTVDTSKKTVVIHDAIQAGGYPVLRQDGSNSALVSGSASNPSLFFANDTNTGLFSGGADQIGLTVGGNARLTIDLSGVITYTGNVAINCDLSRTGSFPGNLALIVALS